MDEPSVEKTQPNFSSRKLLFAALVIFAIFCIGGVFLTVHRRSETRRQAKELDQTAQEGRLVETAPVKVSEPEKDILLIGEARAYYTVTLFARVSGYLAKLFVDIGDTPREGQPLARIESPESEQAYNSARADAFNKKQISDRYRVLLRRKLVSLQEAQQAFTAYDVAEANLRTQGTFRAYQDIVAPFQGRITQRFVDPGALIQNASGSTSAQPLFTISQTDRLRIFIYVDQKDAKYVRFGDPVEVRLPTRPDEKFSAQVGMIAGELDPKTRTLLVEIIMDNQDQRIVAGSFVQVMMKLKTAPLLSLPVQALVMRGNVPLVPVIGPGDKVHYAKIDLEENTGKEVLIRSGVNAGDQVALNIGNSLQEGQKVRFAKPSPETEQGGTAASPSPSPKRD